ncbi:MAG: DUF917 domain-containing protein [Firmicutes bacterium]|nr:DUF917 domain-containing protein [Bacillota bacterium]
MGKHLLLKTDLSDMISGATVLGAGGGGSPENGYRMLKDIPEPIVMYDMDEMGETDYAIMVAGIGSPKVLLESNFGREAITAIETIRSAALIGGRRIRFLMSGEMGGFNTMTPFYVAAHTGLPILDADGNGRAVPGPCLYNLYNIPVNPTVVANGNGDTVIIQCADPLDIVTHEKLMRAATMAFGRQAAFTTWMSGKRDIQDNLVPGCISRAIQIGRTLRIEADEKGNGPLAVCELTGGRVLFRGIVRSCETEVTPDAFDICTTWIDGSQEYTGHAMTIRAINENLVAEVDGETVAMAPDLISTLSADGEPLSNADIRQGQDIYVLAIPAPEPWVRTARAVESWSGFLKTVGCTHAYLPFDRLGER